MKVEIPPFPGYPKILGAQWLPKKTMTGLSLEFTEDLWNLKGTRTCVVVTDILQEEDRHDCGLPSSLFQSGKLSTLEGFSKGRRPTSHFEEESQSPEHFPWIWLGHPGTPDSVFSSYSSLP